MMRVRVLFWMVVVGLLLAANVRSAVSGTLGSNLVGGINELKDNSVALVTLSDGTTPATGPLVAGDVVEGIVNIYDNITSGLPVNGALDVAFAFQIEAVGVSGGSGVAGNQIPLVVGNAPAGTLAKLLTGSNYTVLATSQSADSYAFVSSPVPGDITLTATNSSAASAFADLSQNFTLQASGSIGAFDQAYVSTTVIPTTPGGSVGTEQGSLAVDYVLPGSGVQFLPNILEGELLSPFGSATNDIGFTSQLAVATSNQLGAGWNYQDSSQITVDVIVPEPTTLALLGTGLAGLGAVYLRRKRRA